MTIIYDDQLSDSPYVEKITHGRTLSDGSTIRPAECHWHMVIVRHRGSIRLLVVGPWTAAGTASWVADAEIVWIKFTLGTFMPHLPARTFLDSETALPGAAGKSFWLKGSAWQFPDHDNADIFVDRLVREEVLVRDPLVDAVLQSDPHELSARTIRHRFLRSTGLTYGQIYQFERAQRATALLEQGRSILDTVDAAGYFDQPHLTRSLKRWVGFTPAQIIHKRDPEVCHFIQDEAALSVYDGEVLKNR